jgi:ferredoxin-type protein NapG
MGPDRPLGRRRFFRQALGELLRPLAGAIENIERVTEPLRQLDQRPPVDSAAAAPPVAPTGGRTLIRPPGAADEEQFLKLCTRCGDCLPVCPVQCIKVDGSGQIAGGAPFIDVADNPCILCADLPCAHACPTGALVAVPVEQVRMGTAQWIEQTCHRTSGIDCRVCLDRCPRGTAAIELLDGKVHVWIEGCTGCGVCQFECPTSPKSIVVSSPLRAEGSAVECR